MASAEYLIWYQLCIFFHRLAVIMGLTWITGLAAGFVDLEPVWYVFVGLNTLQGLFIFVAFTCNKKVLFFFHLYSYINFLSWLIHECKKYFEWWRNHGYWGISTLKHFIPWICIENSWWCTVQKFYFVAIILIRFSSLIIL